jgi:hypothetical protein
MQIWFLTTVVYATVLVTTSTPWFDLMIFDGDVHLETKSLIFLNKESDCGGELMR